jgi:hypothetical protein
MSRNRKNEGGCKMLVATITKNKIRDLLKIKGMNIQDMARSANMSYATAWNIVNSPVIPDGVRWGTLKKIADTLNVSVDDLEETIED